MTFSGNFFKKKKNKTGFNLEFYFTIRYVEQFVFEWSRSQKLMNKNKVYWFVRKHVTLNFNNNSQRTKKCPEKLWDRVSCLTVHKLSFSPKTAHKQCWGLKWTKCSDFRNSLKFSFWGLEQGWIHFQTLRRSRALKQSAISGVSLSQRSQPHFRLQGWLVRSVRWAPKAGWAGVGRKLIEDGVTPHIRLPQPHSLSSCSMIALLSFVLVGLSSLEEKN